MGIINFITEQLEQNVDNPKSTECITRFIGSLQKIGSGFSILYLTN